MIQNNFFETLGKRKMLGLLIDPDKYSESDIIKLLNIIVNNKPDIILVGGSIISINLNNVIEIIKQYIDIPVILFPGSYLQLSSKADGILFISLISGRNPEFLIGNHVIAAPLIKRNKLFVIPTGYILINCNTISSVQYMSNTMPIPSDKKDIIIATAQAGEMLGLKTIYLEAGSGAPNHVSCEIISEVKKNISIPLIVGGGIKNSKILIDIFNAGADMAVIGNAIENNNDIIIEMIDAVKNFNEKNSL
jgi:putative glycerol-1-phosphate prenyltransferase